MKDAPITLDTNLLDLKTSGKRAKKDYTYWECPVCGGMNHYSSDSCYVSPGCLARYWRSVSEQYSHLAHEAALKATALEAKATQEQSDDEHHPLSDVV